MKKNWIWIGLTAILLITVLLTGCAEHVAPKGEPTPSDTLPNGSANESEPGCSFQYTLNADEASYSISGVEQGAAVMVIPSVHKDLPVTALGEGVFADCTALTEITVPGSVASIGVRCFEGCTALRSVSLPDSVIHVGAKAFSGCLGLEEVTLGAGLRSIGSAAFEGCTSLTSVEIPDSVTSLGIGAFWGCSALESVTLPFVGCSPKDTTFGDQTSVFGAVFGKTDYEGAVATKQQYSSSGEETYYLPASLTSVTLTGGSSIPYGAFDGCVGLKKLLLSEDLTSIGDYAFRGCVGLTDIVIPKGVTHIGKRVFAYCQGLESLVVEEDNPFYRSYGNCLIQSSETLVVAGCQNSKIPNDRRVRKIGAFAFEGCVGLTELVIPKNIEEIGNAAFHGCSSLERLTVPFLGKSAFDQGGRAISVLGYLFGNAAYDGGVATEQQSSLYASQTYYIPASLRSVTVEGSRVSIPYGAFSGCTGLTEIILSDSVAEIGGMAFSNCIGLTELKIPKSVTKIGHGILTSCSRLERVTVEEGNPIYHSDGNCVIHSENKTLIALCYNSSIPLGGRVTAIAPYTFYCRSDLKSITLPDVITSIGEQAFGRCTELKSVILPKNLTSLGKFAFSRCDRLEHVTVPDGIQHIETGTFGYCFALESVYLGASVKSIGRDAFTYCSSLKSVLLLNVTQIENYAFSLCTSLSRVTILGRLEKIGGHAFSCCYALTQIKLPDTLTELEASAFAYCSTLEKITYTGTVEQWNAVRREEDWAEGIHAKQVTCSGGAVSVANQ